MRFALMLALLSCSPAKKATTPIAPAAPIFTANPAAVPINGKTTLSWSADGYNTCTLKSTQPPNFELDGLAASGSKSVTLGQISTAYLLTCSEKPASEKPAKPGTAVPAPQTSVSYVAVQQ